MKLTMWGHLNMWRMFWALTISASIDKEATQVWGKVIQGMEDETLITPREETIEGRDRQQPNQILGRQIVERAVDGRWSEWGGWSECSKTCDGGKSTRERTCSDPAPNSRGKSCQGSTTKEGRCNTLPCKACVDKDSNRCDGCLGSDGNCNSQTYDQCRQTEHIGDTWCGGGHCSPELWTGYDGKTCGPCVALVKIKSSGKPYSCSHYCAAQDMSCVAAWDDLTNEQCSHSSLKHSCGHQFKWTSDAICHCKPSIKEEKNPFVKLGPNEVCPEGTEITTIERCTDADDWATNLGLVPRRHVTVGKWNAVPYQCSTQVDGDDTIHFSTNSETNNKRFVSGEFVMICEKEAVDPCDPDPCNADGATDEVCDAGICNCGDAPCDDGQICNAGVCA